MGAEPIKLVLSGYYGFQNSGDEAVLHAILTMLEQAGQEEGIRFEPIVLSANPDLTEQMYGVRSVHRTRMSDVLSAIRKSDGLISGGGSLLQDATGLTTIPYYIGVIKIAQWLKKPTFIFSQGIGPVYRRIFYPWIRTIYNQCRYVSVRDVHSKALLEKFGVRQTIHVTADPVLSLPVKSDTSKQTAEQEELVKRSDETVIGISVRFWNEDRSELQGLATVLKKIAAHKKNVRFRFLPFHWPDDREASKYVIELLGKDFASFVELVNKMDHPADMVSEVASCDLLIGMRLHSLITAGSQFVPFLGISYDPKIEAFLEQWGQKPVTTVKQFDMEKMTKETLHWVENQPSESDHHRQIMQSLKKKSADPAKQIALFFRNKG